MDFFEYIRYVFYALIILLHIRIAIIFPPTIIYVFSVAVFFILRDWYLNRGWLNIGRISYIYLFDIEEKKKDFVVYTTDENNVNKVIQTVSATMTRQLLDVHTSNDPIEAFNSDGSTIELYSCGPLISHHLTILAQSFNWGKEDLWLGIVKEDWDNMKEENMREEKVTEEKVKEGKIKKRKIKEEKVKEEKMKKEKNRKKQYVLLDMDDPEKRILNRGRNPHENYIFGQCEYQIDLKIQNRVYRNISICMHVYEDPAVPLYENFWMYGIFCDLKLVEDREIARGNDVYIKFTEPPPNDD